MTRTLTHCILSPLLLLIATVLPTTVQAGGVTDGFYPSFAQRAADQVHSNYNAHPFVALPGLDILSPEPNQLRVQDLRGVECYPQPDNLEVCGAADTTCILLFTKSEERLPDIRLTVRFGEGIEYGGFAEIDFSEDAVFPPPATDLDVISDQNPEAPQFLISEVARDSGAVYICFGIRAECGADLDEFPPTISYEWEYTTESGIACEGSYEAPEDFGGNVITPRVQFTSPLPGSTALGVVNTVTCQDVNITNTGPNSSATGYIFTAEGYGFSDGIRIDRIERTDADGNTTELDDDDFEIDPATGRIVANLDLADSPLAFNEVETISLCFTYSACYDDKDFNPIYTVVSACDGEVCTGPADVNSTSSLTNNFNFAGRVDISYDDSQVMADDATYPADGLPDVCADDPYVFDVLLETTVDTEVEGDILSMFVRLRACASSSFFLSTVQVVNADGTIAGTLDPSTYRVFSDPTFANNGTITREAGTVEIDLRRNNGVQGNELIDVDEDGFFDDLEAGTETRLRLTYDILCDSDDAAGATPTNGMDCQFSNLRVEARRGCGVQAANRTNASTDAPDFSAMSTASFSNGNEDLAGTLEGYNFGTIGNSGSRAPGSTCNDLAPSVKPVTYTYTLADDPLSTCGNDGTTVSFLLSGDPRITNDAVFTDVEFNGNPVAAGDITEEVPEDGTRIINITGDASTSTPGVPQTLTFNVVLDTAYCSPIQIVTFAGTVALNCTDGCECSAAQASAASNIQADPSDCDCDCYLDTEVFSRRISRGFTDETRTTLVPELDTAASDVQARNVLAGDTVELTTRFRIQPEAATSTRFANELALVDRTLIFETQMNTTGNSNWNNADNFPALIDHGLSQLQSFALIRNGVRTEIGPFFDGVTQNLQETGLIIGGFEGQTTVNDFPQDGEAPQPAFPNGGFTFGTGGDGTNDQRDGKRLTVYFRNDPSNRGEFNSIEVFLNAIGGQILPGDEFESVWNVVLVDNPGQSDTPEVPVTFSGNVSASYFINRDANVVANFGERGCPQIPTVLNFFDPQVSAVTRIDYMDGCEGEIVLRWENDDLPAGWYPDEFRPITGIEQVFVDFPFPYAYTGGATYETSGIPPTEFLVDSSAVVDSAGLATGDVVLPEGSIGELVITDAEFANGVRSDGFANFYNGEDDVTTVGGTLPLIGVTGIPGVEDSLVVRIPILRVCGDEPTVTLNAVYSWANKHLPDYEDFPYRRRTSNPSANAYWDGKVTDNNGMVVDPDPGNNPSGSVNNGIQFYFPFQRLPDGPGDEINPHRSIGNSDQYTVLNQPDELTATLDATPAGTLDDMAGPETKTITITPGAGQTLAGAVLVTIGTGGVVTGATDAGGAPLTVTQQAITDTSTILTIDIPMGLAPDEPFVFDLSTDVLFCTAAEICIVPLLGCSTNLDQLAQVYASLQPDCSTPQLCYNYSGGQADVRTFISEPETLDLCSEQTLDVQFFNTGTSSLANFSPVLYIPEGLTASNFMASITGSPPVPLTDPTADPSTDAVFGTGFVFSQAELNAVFGPDGFAPGQALTISFTAMTGCDFTSGVPVVARPRGDAACMIDFVGDLEFSQNIDVALPDAQPASIVSFDAGDPPLQVSCSEDGDQLILTTANVGKASASEAEICLRLPAGIDVNLDNINALAPAGFVVDAGDVTETMINGSGDRQICFMAPPVEQGGFVCLEIPFVVEDLDCGPVFIGATIVTQVETFCQPSGPTCTIPVSTSEMLYQEVNVVPAVTANDATLSASCTSTPGVFDVDYAFDFVAESQPFAGDVTLRLYTDVDANGELDPMIDTQIGTEQSVLVTLQQDEAQSFTGTFPGVDQSEICPLLLEIESPGCTCSGTVLPFPSVLPDFVDDLGDNIVLCPNESFTFDGICADLNYTFANPAAGSVVVDDMTGEATVMLNPGFGVNAREVLNVSGAFGSCSLMKRIGISTVPDLDFGPYEYSVCNIGSQEVDLNIPQALQEDITVEIVNPVSIENPNSVEPIIRDLQQDMTYDVIFTFNDGQCMGMSTLDITVEEAVVATINDLTGCATGFNLSDRITLTPANATGTFQTDGDGTFTPDSEIPGEVSYIPGPMDLEAGFVNLRFNSDEQPGPCGPISERIIATIQLVDCGNFFWDGSRD